MVQLFSAKKNQIWNIISLQNMTAFVRCVHSNTLSTDYTFTFESVQHFKNNLNLFNFSNTIANQKQITKKLEKKKNISSSSSSFLCNMSVVNVIKLFFFVIEVT